MRGVAWFHPLLNVLYLEICFPSLSLRFFICKLGTLFLECLPPLGFCQRENERMVCRNSANYREQQGYKGYSGPASFRTRASPHPFLQTRGKAIPAFSLTHILQSETYPVPWSWSDHWPWAGTCLCPLALHPRMPFSGTTLGGIRDP